MEQAIRKIGNSSGVILPKSMLFKGGFEKMVEIVQIDDYIILKPIKTKPRSNWETQMKEAINQGNNPDNDLFEGMGNEFDKTEW